jgi:DDB1- and CUL4-associated factor 11
MASIGCHRLPDTLVGKLDHFQASLFSAVFNREGTMVSVASQDAAIALFETDQLLYRSAAAGSPPLRPVKEIQCQDVGWSIIGSAFSPDGKWIAYSSWSRYLHLANTWGQHCQHEAYLVSASRSRHFCLFSIQFSSDGTRVVGGGNDGGVHVIHLERKVHTSIEEAHCEDVNAVSFLWPENDSLLVSGSDDGLLKLWDLRTPDRARGLCVGHAEGIASIASKGNGIHVVSNSKDQTAKLWDLRRLRDASPEATSRYAVDSARDYRWDEMGPSFSARRGGGGQPDDTSLLTFTGHRVARTLIQVAFSPHATTGGRFVLSGSADGAVCVYDTLQAPPEGEGPAGSPAVVRPTRRLSFHRDCVRTVACAPHHDLLVSAGWDHRLGLWRFMGEPDDKE